MRNSPETVFRIASVTKQFTAMAILQLCERGKLRLDDRLAPFFPDFPAAADEITVHQVLTHTAGLPDFVSVEQAARLPLESRPGERLNYSNVGYEMLGRDHRGGLRDVLEEYLAANIFGPLEGSDPHRRGLEAPDHSRPGGRLQPDEKGGISNADYSDTGKSPAAGGLCSNVDDLMRWDQALYSGALVKPDAGGSGVQAGHTEQRPAGGYGCGWTVGTHRGLREVGHGGDISGYNAYIARYPDQRFTVVVLSNMTMRPAGPIPTAGELAHRIAELLLSDDMDPAQPPPDVRVDAAVLDAYVGRYRLEAPKIILQNAGDLCTFTRDGNRLVAQLGAATVPLFAESDATFYSKGVPARITFIRDGAGRVTEFILVLGGVREYARCGSSETRTVHDPDRDEDCGRGRRGDSRRGRTRPVAAADRRPRDRDGMRRRVRQAFEFLLVLAECPSVRRITKMVGMRSMAMPPAHA